MRLARPLVALVVVAAAALIAPACGGDDAPAIVHEGGGGAVAGTMTDAGVDAPPEAAPTCEDFAGAYRGEGSCNPGTLTFPWAICVRQTGCDLVVKTNADQTYSGVAGETFKVTTNDPAVERCTGVHSSGIVAMHCSGPKQGESCDGKATPEPLPGATSPCCDLHGDACGAGARCAPIDTVSGGVFTACVPDDGALGPGDACSRTAPTAAAVGRDACEKGLYCTDFGTPTPDGRACRELCLLDADCPAGEACFGVGATPWAGVCVPTCALFDEGSCADGMTCRVVASHDSYGLVWNTRCGATGAKGAGEACSQPEECGPSLGCVAGVCEPWCDATHACPDGLSCAEYPSRKADGFGATIGQCH